jgi:hypothetical protein
MGKPLPTGPLAPGLMSKLRLIFKEEMLQGKFQEHPLQLDDAGSNQEQNEILHSSN